MTHRIGYAQFTPTFGDVAGNLDRLEALVAGAAADLLVLPELALSGYQFRDRAELEALAVAPGGTEWERLAALAVARGCVLVAGVAERAGGAVYNATWWWAPDGTHGTYRKVHLFAREKAIFDPGDLGFPVWPIGGLRLGVLICFDWIFPEAARTLALRGADVIAHPSNLVLPHAQRAMPVRCLENRVFAVTANRCGAEARTGEELVFTGRSQISGPDGEILASSGATGDEVRVVEVDLARARDKHVTPFDDVLADRRPDQYGGDE